MEQAASPSFLAELHEKHKQRQERIRAAAIKDLTVEPIRPIGAPPEEPTDPLFPIKVVTGKALEQGLEVLRSRPSHEIIIDKVCEHFKVRQEDILSSRRLNYLASHRQMLAYMMYWLTDYSLPKIAVKIGRDPTTIGYAIKKIQSNLSLYRQDIEELEAKIRPLLPPKRKI